MSQATPLLQSSAQTLECSPQLVMGRVHTVLDEYALVSGAFGMVKARRATGCLLEPRAHDTVLVVMAPTVCYVLHVLERQDADSGQLVLPSRTAIRLAQPLAEDAPSGLHMLVQNMQISVEDQLTLSSNELNTKAEKITVHGTLLSLSGKALLQRFSTLHTVATHVFQHVRRFFGIHGTSVQKVEDILDIRSGRTRMHSADGFDLHARHASITTEDTVRIDGKRINLG